MTVMTKFQRRQNKDPADYRLQDFLIRKQRQMQNNGKKKYNLERHLEQTIA